MFVTQDLHYENHSVLLLLQWNVYVERQDLHFLFGKYKDVNMLPSCIWVTCFFENTVQTGSLYFSLRNTWWKVFGNNQELLNSGKVLETCRKMFLCHVLSLKLECIYFWCGFLRIGSFCFWLSSVKPCGDYWYYWCIIPESFGKKLFGGVFEGTQCWKSVNIVFVMAIDDKYFDL